MSEKEQPSTPPTPPGSIQTGDIEGTGIAVGHGAQAVVTQTGGEVSDEIARAFAAIAEKLSALPDGPNKEDAQDALTKLEAEARKGDQADEGRARRWLDFLAEAAPDAWDVAVNAFINPIKGVATVFQKIAERAKADKAQKEADAKT